MALTQVQGQMILASGQSIPRAALPVGSVLQVVQSTFTTQTTYTAQPTSNPANFVDTGLSATITPTSASSKILVITTVQALLSGAAAASADSGYGWGYQICNSSNTILLNSLGDTGGPLDCWFQSGYVKTSGQTITKQLLHSPATTSPYTYKVRVGARQDTSPASLSLILNYSSGSSYVPQCTITLMEISA